MSAPTLRERIAERLDRHLPESYGDTGCALRCGWSDEGTTDSAGEHLADAVLAVVADWLTEPEQAVTLSDALERATWPDGEQALSHRILGTVLAPPALAALADRVREGEA